MRLDTPTSPAHSFADLRPPLMDALSSPPLFPGDLLFKLKTTHGCPWDMALDVILVQKGLSVDWAAFIEAARREDWWDYQLYEAVCHAMVDAEIPRAMQAAIRQRFQRYVVTYPHPRMS